MLRLHIIGICFGLVANSSQAQIPVEIFIGHEKATIDLMFFKYFKNNSGVDSKWLFFNRNRALIDYEQTTTSNLPQFGFTEAVSYNHKSLKGVAPVLVGQILNRGTFVKGGIQYALIRKDFTVFSWVVSELKSQPSVDFFLMVRYTPKISEKYNLFAQLETINVFPTKADVSNSYTQRLRIGMKRSQWQSGLGADFNQSVQTANSNLGVFIRHEF